MELLSLSSLQVDSPCPSMLTLSSLQVDSPCPSMLSLPHDIWPNILIRLDGESLLNFSTTCKSANAVVWSLSQLRVGVRYNSIMESDDLELLQRVLAVVEFDGAMFRSACRYGASSIVRKFFPLQSEFPTERVVVGNSTRNFDAFELAVVSKKNEVLSLLLEDQRFSKLDCQLCSEAELRRYTPSGRCVDPTCKRLFVRHCQALWLAVYVGNLGAVQLLLERKYYAGDCTSLFLTAIRSLAGTPATKRNFSVLQTLAASEMQNDAIQLADYTLESIWDDRLSSQILALLMRYNRVEVPDPDELYGTRLSQAYEMKSSEVPIL